MDSINARIAKELNVQAAQVSAAVGLLGEGATVPFIARYRKEKTGGLDDTQLRKLEERLGYLTELEDRRATVLKSITEQGKLTPELQRAINAADTKVELEDIYTPFKPKRRTKAQIAREAGLEPLADVLLENPALEPSKEAEKFLSTEERRRGYEGRARGCALHFDRANERERQTRRRFASVALDDRINRLESAQGQTDRGAKFSDYFDFHQSIREIPRTAPWALLRGRNEDFLDLDLDVEVDPGRPHPAELRIMSAFNIADRARPRRQMADRYGQARLEDETAYFSHR